MIAVFAQGGLGNQLFQYATARAVALRHGTTLVIDPSWYQEHVPKRTPRSLGLTGCRIVARMAMPDEAIRFAGLRGPLRSRLPVGRPWHPLRERQLNFQRRVLDAPEGSYLIGYWQSWRYFDSIRSVLLQETLPVAPLDGPDAELGAMMAGTDSIAVHVRRGDYVAVAATAAYHGICAPSYYGQAVGALASGLRDPVAFVFTDDPSWVREHLRLPIRYEIVERHGPDAALADLALMRQCRHFAIANSSYSWWGAWLGTHPRKRVAAPARWYADGRATPDLLPPDWRRLE
jgi:hypothetical protein